MLAAEFNAPWRGEDAAFPHDIVEKLIVAVVIDHPKIILLTNADGRAILEELGIQIPPGYGVSNIVGHANPGIAVVRAKLSQEAAAHPEWTTYDTPH